MSEICYRDERGDTYRVQLGATLSEDECSAVLAKVKDVEELRAFLIRHPDQRYYLQPATGRFVQEVQGRPAPDAIYCGWVRFNSASGRIDHGPDTGV
jgi:hypothetical protein